MVKKAPFKILYSNDCSNIENHVSPYHSEGQPFMAEMLEASIDETAGTCVDVHMLQPGDGEIPYWKSNICPPKEHYEWFMDIYGVEPDEIGKYMLSGGDIVDVFVRHCRRKCLNPFISLRLNDAHGKEHAYIGRGRANPSLSHNVSRFYYENPQYRLGSDITSWEQHVYNWAIQEVRERKLGFIEEICENYDIEGFEIDFMRHPNYFLVDETTSEQRMNIMTDFCREVRKILDKSSKNGHHRWLCARIPCFLAAFDAIGLDITAMAKEGVEMFNVSPSFFTSQETDLAVIRKVVSESTVYMEMCHSLFKIGIESSQGKTPVNFNRMVTPEQYYTTAHIAYAQGADGLSFFNFVYTRKKEVLDGKEFSSEPPFSILKDIGNSSSVAAMPQHYFISPGWTVNGYINCQVPCSLGKGEVIFFRMNLIPPTGGWRNNGKLRIQSKTPMLKAAFSMRFNGILLSEDTDISEPYQSIYSTSHFTGNEQTLRAWMLPYTILKEGINELKLELIEGDSVEIIFVDLGVQHGA